jgi:hypothetical protein
MGNNAKVPDIYHKFLKLNVQIYGWYESVKR